MSREALQLYSVMKLEYDIHQEEMQIKFTELSSLLDYKFPAVKDCIYLILLSYITKVHSIHCRECRHSRGYLLKAFLPFHPPFLSFSLCPYLPPSFLFPLPYAWNSQKAGHLVQNKSPLFMLFFRSYLWSVLYRSHHPVRQAPMWGPQRFLCNPHCLSGAAWSW